jgi:Pyruvate/2-oxoacid:ferredoxin oxidoreductase delta subunit
VISRRALFQWELDVPAANALVAAVSTFACLNSKADFCATCVERCPEPGALRVEARRIVVDAERCTGCGECVARCPAPGGAILLRPVAA